MTEDIWGPYVRGSAGAAVDPPVIEFIDHVLETFEKPVGLDLGCGGGRLLKHLRGMGVEAIGLDSSAAALRAKGLDVFPCDLTEPLPLEDGSFDFAVMWGVFLHLPPESHGSVLDEIDRCLRPGGLFLLDFLKPDDFRNALGTKIGDDYNDSPFISGVTDFFCEPSHVRSLTAGFELLHEKDVSREWKDEGLVSQMCLWLRAPVGPSEVGRS